MAKMDILHFAGLMQTTTSSFLRQDDQLELAINVHGDNVGALQKRLGYAQYGDTVETSQSVLGLQSYADISGGTRNLFCYINGKIRYNNAGTWTSVETGLLADAKAEFTVFLDQLYMVGKNSSGTQLTTALVDGITYATTGNVSGAPTGNYIEVFRDRVYIVDDSDVYFSSIPSSDVITWDTSSDKFTVYTRNGEDVTSIHTNKSLNKLLIFKESTMHAWDTYRLMDVGSVGTTAHRSVVTCNYTTMFYNAKTKGVYAYLGTEPQLISRSIQKWVDGIQNPSDVFAGKDDEWHYKLYVGQVIVDGTTYNNCELRYSLADNTWTIYKYYHNLTCYAQHQVSGVTRLYAGDENGKVYQLAITGDTIYADDGNAIAAEILTKNYDLGVPSERKYIDKVTVFSSNPQNLTGRIRADKGDWTTHFSIDKNIQELNVNPVDGYFYQFHFSESSTVKPFVLEGLTFTPHLTTMRNE